jgi:Spy/CpxP family protein refolding chaperone
MRTLVAVLALAMGTFLYATLPAAAEQKADDRVVVLVERIQDLQLTDAQEAKIAEVRKECGTKIKEDAKELAGFLKQEVDKVEGVLTAEQKRKLAESKEERKEIRGERLAERLAHLHDLDLTEGERAKFMEIRKEFHPRVEKAMKGLEGLLSDEQKKARADALKAGKNRREVFAALKLTDAQKEKIEEIGKEVRTIVHDELVQMRDVLTESQKAKLEEFKDERKEHVRDHMAHRIANFKELNLTADQKEKIAEIRKEFRPKVHEAGNKLRTAAREEVMEILNVIKG